MNEQEPIQRPEHLNTVVQLALCSTAAIISGHLFFILLTGLSLGGMALWMHLPLWHFGIHLMPENGSYNSIALATVYGAPFILIVLVTTVARTISRRLARTPSAWAIWTHWLVVVGLSHIIGNLVLGLDPHQGTGFLLAGISRMFGHSAYVAPALVLGGLAFGCWFLKRAGRGFFRLSSSHSVITKNPVKFAAATVILPWLLATAIFWEAFPAAIVSDRRLIIWITLGVYLCAAVVRQWGHERSISVVKNRKISRIGTVVIPCILAIALYIFGHYGLHQGGHLQGLLTAADASAPVGLDHY